MLGESRPSPVPLTQCDCVNKFIIHVFADIVLGAVASIWLIKNVLRFSNYLLTSTRTPSACGVLDDDRHDRYSAPADILNTHFLDSLFYSACFCCCRCCFFFTAAILYLYLCACVPCCWISRAHDTTFTSPCIA